MNRFQYGRTPERLGMHDLLINLIRVESKGYLKLRSFTELDQETDVGRLEECRGGFGRLMSLVAHARRPNAGAEHLMETKLRQFDSDDARHQLHKHYYITREDWLRTACSPSYWCEPFIAALLSSVKAALNRTQQGNTLSILIASVARWTSILQTHALSIG